MPNHVQVDPKLLHLVRKILPATDDNDPAVIIEQLKAKYREYRRKDSFQLTTQVEAAIAQIEGVPRKRKEREEEEAYDQLALEEDAMREQYGGGLNASLRNRYKQVQLERENSAVSEGTTEQNGDDNSASGGNNDKEGSVKKSDGSEVTPKTKRRKVKMRRLPSIPEAGSDADFLAPVARPIERYSDLGGMSHVIQQIRQLIEYPLIRPELYRHLGVDPPRGVLLRGPPGMRTRQLVSLSVRECWISDSSYRFAYFL